MLRSWSLVEPWICARCLSKGQTVQGKRTASTHAGAKLYGASRARKRPVTWRQGLSVAHVSLPSRRAISDGASPESAQADPYFDVLDSFNIPDGGIRQHLADWQDKYGTRNTDLPSPFEGEDGDDGVSNESMRLQRTENVTKALETEPEDLREDTIKSTSDDISGLEYEYLSPGDLVEITAVGNREPTIGIFVRDFGIMTAQIYTMNGTWLHVRTKKLRFSIPGFMNADLLKDIIPYLPKEEDTSAILQEAHAIDIGVPRQVAAPVLKKLQAFWRDVQELYRKHASVLDNAHQILAHQTDLRFGTLEKITRKLLGARNGEPSSVALLAVRRALSRSQGFALDSRSHRFTRVFLIHPKDAMVNVEKAAAWIRQWQDAEAKRASTIDDTSGPSPVQPTIGLGAQKVDRFIAKAKDLIERNRKIRPANPYMSMSPSTVQHQITPDQDGYRLIPSLRFNESDQVLLNFLEAATLNRQHADHQQYQALASALGRGIGMQGDLENYSWGTLYKILSEMGVTKPYENRSLHDEHILLPNSKRSKPLERLRDAISKVDDGLSFPDTMKHVRQDWKDLNVYCIDSKYAMNIDDGFSVEPVAGKTDQWWIRIHIANPTARISKDHDVARMAAHMTMTYYAPDDHHWLMPSWITQKFMSIAPDRPVLTFSARVDKEANLLEYDVQSGIVRKVHRFTPTSISRLLSNDTTPLQQHVLTVGNAPQWFEAFDRSDELPSITSQQKKDLNCILALAAARAKKRIAKGGMIIHFPSPSVYTTYSMREGAPQPSQIPMFREVAHFMEGDPAIRVSAAPFDGFAEQSLVDSSNMNSMVQEMMLLCGEISARWCSDRNVPIMYRGTIDHSTVTSIFSREEFFELYIKPHIQKTGRAPYQMLNIWMGIAGRTATTLTPMPHALSGLEQYAKVTTPLGRYGDMIAHWQIESALREEARTGKSLVGSKREDYLAFTRAELAPVVPRLRAREQLLERSKRFCEDHWIHQAFFRAHHFGEGEFATRREVIIHGGHVGRGRGVCMGFDKIFGGMPFQIAMPLESFKTDRDGELWARPDDHWEVEVTSVDTVNRAVHCNPVRLLYRQPYKIDDVLKSDLSALTAPR